MTGIWDGDHHFFSKMEEIEDADVRLLHRADALSWSIASTALRYPNRRYHASAVHVGVTKEKHMNRRLTCSYSFVDAQPDCHEDESCAEGFQAQLDIRLVHAARLSQAFPFLIGEDEQDYHEGKVQNPHDRLYPEVGSNKADVFGPYCAHPTGGSVSRES
jgi:hypothetical protein